MHVNLLAWADENQPKSEKVLFFLLNEWNQLKMSYFQSLRVYLCYLRYFTNAFLG